MGIDSPDRGKFGAAMGLEKWGACVDVLPGGRMCIDLINQGEST